MVFNQWISHKDATLIPYLGFADSKQVEYIVISELNFVRLEQISKLFIEVDKQVYEDIPGFESLRIIFKIRLSALYFWFFQFYNQSFIFYPLLSIFNIVDTKTGIAEKQFSYELLRIERT